MLQLRFHRRSVALGLILRAALFATATRAAALQAQTALSLGDAARLAARQNGGVDVARARVAQADARVAQRRSALLPDVVAGIAQSSRTSNSATFGLALRGPTGQPLLDPNGQLLGPIPTIDLRYRIQQPLLDLGSIARWRAAQAATTAAQADVDVLSEGAAATAAAAYVRAIRADAHVAARSADSLLAADLLRIARDQLQAGLGIAIDVTRAQSQLAATKAQLLMSRTERDRTRLELRRALGLPLDAPLVLRDSLAALPLDAVPMADTSAHANAFDTRADVRALVAQGAAQSRVVRAIRLERTPQLGLVFDQGQIGKSVSHLLPTYTWGVQVSLGVFDGFRREGRVEEQMAVSREIDARLRELRAQSALDVRAALLELASAREQVDAAQERLTLADQEVAQAQQRFRAGVAGNADVISALLSLNQSRTLRIDALASYQSARVALARATGSVQQLP